MAKILLVDDDILMAQNLSLSLLSGNYVVAVAHSGEDAMEKLAVDKFDVLILDWELPGMSGLDICKRFRSTGGTTPILMVTGRDKEQDIETGLDAGADDYVTKPFDLRVLQARLRALLRRPELTHNNSVAVGGLTIDLKLRSVFINSQELRLQPLEFAVIEFLARHPKQIFSAETLILRVWDSDSSVSSESVYNCIRRLRQKLSSAGRKDLICSRYGEGYWLNPETDESTSL